MATAGRTVPETPRALSDYVFALLAEISHPEACTERLSAEAAIGMDMIQRG
jgi:hypothetical protein